MPDVQVRRKHGKSYREVKKIVAQVAEELSRTLKTDYRFDGDTLVFKRSGVNGTISYDDEHIEFQASLGMLMKPLGTALKGAVNKKLDEYIA